MTDDLIATLRDQLDEFEPPDGPERIRLNEMVPRGMVIRTPFEYDKPIPDLGRTVDDDGPQEYVVNPDDFDELVESMTIGPAPLAVSIFGIPVIDERRKPSNKQTGGES